jgi:hypothetical protein
MSRTNAYLWRQLQRFSAMVCCQHMLIHGRDLERRAAEAFRPAGSHLRRQRRAGVVHAVFPGGRVAVVAPRLIVAFRAFGRKHPPRFLETGARGIEGFGGAVAVFAGMTAGIEAARRRAWLSYQPARRRNRCASNRDARGSDGGSGWASVHYRRKSMAGEAATDCVRSAHRRTRFCVRAFRTASPAQPDRQWARHRIPPTSRVPPVALPRTSGRPT